jgi:hypothetical protein
MHVHNIEQETVPKERQPAVFSRDPPIAWNTVIIPEPEFLNILKCNSAESAGTGFQFNFMIFLMIKLLQ